MTPDDQKQMAAALDAMGRGHMVVVVDHENRENEGDLIMAADKATPQAVAFMIRHTSGILCTALEGEEAKRLNLWPMVAENDAPLTTAFTVSVDYRHGLTTGISAEERCNTVRGLANPNSGQTDFVRPGHIFPLIARPGGVLMRTGHTEAAVDLARLSGASPVGLLAELVNDDGSVKKGRQITDFAAEHGLAVISVEQLVAWRQAREMLIERVAEMTLNTAIGSAECITYSSRYDNARHLALIFGDIRNRADVLVRLHPENIVDDVFGGPARVLDSIQQRIADAGSGVIVYLRHDAEGVTATASDPVVGEADADKNGNGGRNGDGHAGGRRDFWYDVGLGAQILRDLNLSTIRVLASRERQYIGLAGFGITITGTEII